MSNQAGVYRRWAGVLRIALGVAVVGALALTASEARAGPLAPKCVGVQQLSRHKVRVTNGCSTTERVKVIWAWGKDSNCVSLPRGWFFDSSSGSLSRFDRVESC